MEEKKNNYLGNLLSVFNKLSVQQRMLITGVIVGSLVLLVFIIFFFNEPNYSVLFANLAPEDANSIVENLTSQKVPYKLEDEGKTIKVPKDRVYELRLVMAGKGFPSTGVVGYELFDKQVMGMSEFMQKLNFKRAVEGELSKTIMQQKGIDNARVHIVIPQRAVFKDEQKLPTASVVLKMKNGTQLTEGNVTAITNLVASSVEGLKPGKVTIVDTRGKMLTKNEEEGQLASFTNKQYEIKGMVETYLAQKAQSTLDEVLGFGNAVVKVNVDLDFNQVEKTMETFDPNSQVEISNQSVKSNSNGKNISDTTALTNENTTTNYEVSKTIEKVIAGAGNIKRLSVSAVVNELVKEVKTGDKVQRVSEPRAPEQMQKIEQIVTNTVGVNPERNDQISVVNISFENQLTNDTGVSESSPMDIIEKWGNLILMLGAIIAALFVLKGLLGRLKEEKILIGTVSNEDGSFDGEHLSSGQGHSRGMGLNPLGLDDGMRLELSHAGGAPTMEIGDISREISDEALKRKVRQDKIVTYVAKNPAEAAKLINLWLKEDEYEQQR